MGERYVAKPEWSEPDLAAEIDNIDLDLLGQPSSSSLPAISPAVNGVA